LIYRHDHEAVAWFDILEAARFVRVKYCVAHGSHSHRHLSHHINELPSRTVAQLLDLEVVPQFGQREGLTAGDCVNLWRVEHDLPALSLDIFAAVYHPLCILMVYSFGVLAIAKNNQGAALSDPEEKRYWQCLSMISSSSSSGSTSAQPIEIYANAEESSVFHGSMFQELAEFISRTVQLADPQANMDDVSEEVICSL